MSHCPHCEEPRFTVAVPASLEAYTEASAFDCCPHCLAIEAGDPAAIDPDPPWASINDRFPTGDQAVGLLVLIDRLDSLALNRSEIESLVAQLEADGLDLFLTLDRLVAAPEVEPYLDLGRRRTQLDDIID